MLETLDHTIRIGSTPTFLYFDLYLYSAYAAHYVYNSKIVISELIERNGDKLNQVKTTNNFLAQLCNKQEWKLVHHNNITSKLQLNASGLHLNSKET